MVSSAHSRSVALTFSLRDFEAPIVWRVWCQQWVLLLYANRLYLASICWYHSLFDLRVHF